MDLAEAQLQGETFAKRPKNRSHAGYGTKVNMAVRTLIFIGPFQEVDWFF